MDQALFVTNFGAFDGHTQQRILSKSAKKFRRDRDAEVADLLVDVQTAATAADTGDANTLLADWIETLDPAELPDPFVAADFIAWIETQ